MIERGKRMGEPNDGIGNDYGKLQGADAPALLAFDVPGDADESGYRALARYESHAEALGFPISDVHCGEVIYTPSIERMAEGTVAQMGALLNSFSADEELAYCEGDVLLYLERGFERAKPLCAQDSGVGRHQGEAPLEKRWHPRRHPRRHPPGLTTLGPKGAGFSSESRRNRPRYSPGEARSPRSEVL